MSGSSTFAPTAEALRRKLLKPWSFKLYLWLKLPLAAFAGLRIEQLDEGRCVVSLKGGWRSQNPFGSTYFAAQAMAAEMSTGAPALLLSSTVEPSVAMLVTKLEARYDRRILGVSRFTCEDVPALADAIQRAQASEKPVVLTVRSVARDREGEVCSEFEVTWSFKRRSART